MEIKSHFDMMNIINCTSIKGTNVLIRDIAIQ